LVDDATEVIQRRDREIQEITRSISDLATIFQELQTLVIDQGTLLDRIDYNIEQVHTHTHRAVEELDKVNGNVYLYHVYAQLFNILGGTLSEAFSKDKVDFIAYSHDYRTDSRYYFQTTTQRCCCSQ
jgi:methyl-accepting chemotaxis protein